MEYCTQKYFFDISQKYHFFVKEQLCEHRYSCRMRPGGTSVDSAVVQPEGRDFCRSSSSGCLLCSAGCVHLGEETAQSPAGLSSVQECYFLTENGLLSILSLSEK